MLSGHTTIVGYYKGNTGSMMQIIRYFQQDLKKSLDGVPLILKVQLGRYLADVEKEMMRRHSTGYSAGKNSGGSLQRRSGAALKSIKEKRKVTGGSTIQSVKGVIGGVGYLNIQEDGGTITANKSKYLTIPTEYALRANGTPIKPRARDWKDTFIKKSKKGNLVIFQKRGRKIVPLYILKRSVTIKPRLGMGKALYRWEAPFVKRFMDAVDQQF